MALIILLPLLLSLLRLFAGVCFGRVEGDDPINLETRVFIKPYLTDNLTAAIWNNHRVILALSQKGQCMSYIAFDEDPLESLASCELYCFMNGGFNSWDCIAPEVDTSNDYWNNAFTDEMLFQWSPGTCSCSNSTSPTPSIFGDADGDDYSPSSSPSKLQPEVKEATRKTRELAMTYDYRIEVDIDDLPVPQPGWDFSRITWANQESDRQPNKEIIGIFAVMNNNINNGVLRIHEAWAGKDTRPTGQRAAFYDDVINFWARTPLNRPLDQLTELRFDTVIEDTLVNQLESIYKDMGASLGESLTVFKDGQKPNENFVFEAIMSGTRFTRSMQHAIDEYVEFSHRTIEGFYFEIGFPGTDFSMYFDGYDPNTIGEWSWVESGIRKRPLVVLNVLG